MNWLRNLMIRSTFQFQIKKRYHWNCWFESRLESGIRCIWTVIGTEIINGRPRFYFLAYFLVKPALSRLIDSVLCIMRNWWIDHADNNIYKCLFMLHETICAQQPSSMFKMPKLKQVLENVASGKSYYPHWGKGSV